MAKITINIKTLNLDVTLPGAKQNGPSLGDLLGAAIHVRHMCEDKPVTGEPVTGEPVTGEPPAAEPAGEPVTGELPTAQAPTFDEENILDFLDSDERYSMRTAASVAKHFGVAEWEASDMLRHMASAELVRTRRRRSDGITLYAAYN